MTVFKRRKPAKVNGKEVYIGFVTTENMNTILKLYSTLKEMSKSKGLCTILENWMRYRQLSIDTLVESISQKAFFEWKAGQQKLTVEQRRYRRNGFLNTMVVDLKKNKIEEPVVAAIKNRVTELIENEKNQG